MGRCKYPRTDQDRPEQTAPNPRHSICSERRRVFDTTKRRENSGKNSGDSGAAGDLGFPIHGANDALLGGNFGQTRLPGAALPASVMSPTIHGPTWLGGLAAGYQVLYHKGRAVGLSRSTGCG